MAFNPIFGLLLAAGAAALVLVGKPPNAAAKSDPKPGGGGPGSALPGADKVPPANVLNDIAAAVASGSPAKMRAEADVLDRLGFPAHAADLRAAALVLEKLIAGAAAQGVPTVVVPAVPGTAPPFVPPFVAPIVVPEIVIRPDVAASMPVAADPLLVLAGRTALMLNMKGRGSEDKKMVAAFQTQETRAGYYTGTIDGLYGPKSGIAFAKHWAIIPPKPYYWPKATAEAAAAKASWRSQMLAMAARDVPRAEEWTRIANV